MSGFRDPAGRPIDFDPARLARRLGVDAVSVTRIAGGQSNPTYFVEAGGRRYVLRKKPAGVTLPSAHAIEREYRVLAALADTDVPVPRVTLLEEDPETIGAAFYLMERLDGRVFSDCALPELAREDRALAFRALAQGLARLHRVDWRAIGLDGFGRPENYFARQVARWSKQWGLSRTREDANIDMLASWLAENLPEDVPPTIVHGDYRVGNVMFAPDAPRLVGVLDWELSTIGQPLADLAHVACGWRFAPDQLGGVAGLDLAARGLPDFEAFHDEYRRASGCDAPIGPFHHAFALFRYAVIFEGIAARHRDGSAAGDNAAAVGALSAVCAEQAVALLSTDKTAFRDG